MVMATAFVKAVKEEYPYAEIDCIVKKGPDVLLDHFPTQGRRYIFSKQEYKGLKGARKFGRQIRKEKKYDLFFCLPDSLSSAAMGAAVRAKKSIGFKKDIRFLLFSDTFKKKKGIHRVEEYVDLLEQFIKKKLPVPLVSLSSNADEKNDTLVININSEASSRRLPAEKAVSIINTVRKMIPNEIILVGSPDEKFFVDSVYDLLINKTGIRNEAGNTSLDGLVHLFASAKAVLTTDSGPAHVANALGTKAIVLFGAGNENNTAPYNTENRVIIRLGKLACEPCRDNMCKIYGRPECLLQLDENRIAEQVLKMMA